VAAAAAFYTEVVGWGAQDASVPGTPYTLLTTGERTVAALMSLPPGARDAGATPRWVGYVSVDDIDAATERLARRGGIVHVPPTDIADISRIAIVADPQMAMLGLITWLDADEERSIDASEAGRAGWHELLAADAGTAFAFYAELFGWQKAETGVDPGAGTYQLFSAAGVTIGGMFTKPTAVPVSFWLYYFNVGDIDAAAARTTAAGGKILEGPVVVMGGAWVVRGLDPQGAMFALMGPRSKGATGYFGRDASPDSSATRDRRWSW
jgi:predicted enzyme related to lactoylglutathione lyase